MMAYSTFWVLFILKEMQSVKSVGMMSKIRKLSKTLSLCCKDEVFDQSPSPYDPTHKRQRNRATMDILLATGKDLVKF